MDEFKFRYAIENTEILRPHKQGIFTFTTTFVPYYLVAESMGSKDNTEVRKGVITAEKPQIIVPSSLTDMLFEGCRYKEELRTYVEEQGRLHGVALDYRFRNELKYFKVINGSLKEISARVIKEADGEDIAVIKGVADSYEISLIKYTVLLIINSFKSNITELKERGFFDKLR